MSRAPYLLPGAREGQRLGNAEMIDSVIQDGLWCACENWHMGMTGEAVAEKYGVSRIDQDAYAAASHNKAVAARAAGAFADEILPVSIAAKKGPAVVFDRDEAVREDTTPITLAALKPAFTPTGTVTAGNAPGLNDGAAALVVMSAAEAEARGLTPLARDRRAGDQRPRAEVGDDDARRRGTHGAEEGRLGDRRRRPVRDQRSVRRAGGRGDARARPRRRQGQRARRRRRARPSDRRERRPRPHHAAPRDEATTGERGIAALCLGGGNGVALAVER